MPALWLDVHGCEVFERFVDVVNDQAEVLIAYGVGGLISSWFPVGEDLDVLALVEFQKHQLLPLAPRAVREKPASRQKLRLPADNALHVRCPDRYMPKTHAMLTHKRLPYFVRATITFARDRVRELSVRSCNDTFPCFHIGKFARPISSVTDRATLRVQVGFYSDVYESIGLVVPNFTTFQSFSAAT